MKLLKLASLILSLMAVLVVGCSDDEETPTGPTYQSTNTTERAPSGDYWITSIDATSYDDFVYYNIGDRDTVTVSASELETSTAWDIAFRRDAVITNSGISGPGDLTGVDLTANGISKLFLEVTAADVATVPQSAWMEDSYSLVIDEYYDYNFQTHVLTPTNLVYAMKDAEGKYLKFQISEFIGGGAPPAMANFVIKYVYAASGTDLSGTPVVDTVDGSSGMFYYDFSSGSAVSPADPSNSSDWDIVVSSYDIFLNSTFSGPGLAAANPANALVTMTDPTDMSQYSEAETVSQAYDQDQKGSAFLNWYDYNGQTHKLTSKGHVYAYKVGSKTYKFYIESYYDETGTVGANYTVWWAEL